MKTTSCLAILYLTSMSILMCGENFVSEGCRVLLLKLLEDMKVNWIVYVANFFTVIYIVSLAIKEYERNPRKETTQETDSSAEPSDYQRSPPKAHVITLVNLHKIDDASCDESCSNSDEADSGISATVSKEDSKTEVEKQTGDSKDESEWELGHQELVSRIKEILLEANKGRADHDDEKDLSEGEFFLPVTPVSSNEDVFYTPQKNKALNQIDIMNLSASPSDDEILLGQLDTIDEENSWKSDSLRSQTESQNAELQKDGNNFEANPVVFTTTQDHFHGDDAATANHGTQPLVHKDELQLYLDDDGSEDNELNVQPHYRFSEPHNLLSKERNTKEAELHKSQSQDDYKTADEDKDEAEKGDGERGKDDYQDEDEPMDTQDDSLDYNFSITDSFSEVISKLPPGSFYSGNHLNLSVTDTMSPSINLTGNDSLLNTTFSVSSLEDILSPEVRHQCRVPTTSPHCISGSMDQSLDANKSRFLGIRLHKPAGLKDVLLSIVSVDEEKGMDTVSDTWTLGNREGMELILAIDETLCQSHRHYVGRYSLVFSDVKDNTFEDALETTPDENSLLHSFLKDRESESYVADSMVEDDIDQLSISRFGRLVWKAAHAPQETQDNSVDAPDELNPEAGIDEFHEVSYIEDACSEVFENVHNASRDFVVRLHDMSRDLLNDEQNLRNAAMAAGCIAFTCFVLYRAL